MRTRRGRGVSKPELYRQIREGGSTGPLTVGRWLTSWIEERRARGVLAATDELPRVKFILPTLGNVPLRDFTKAMALDWVRSLPRLRTHRGTPLSPRTVHHVASTLKQAMAEAAKRGLVPMSPRVWDRADLPPKDCRGRRSGSGREGTAPAMWNFSSRARLFPRTGECSTPWSS